MRGSEPIRTKGGKILTDTDIQALADEAERGYDITHLLPVTRSTPLDYPDCAVVTDKRGRTWTYSEPTDTWATRDGNGYIAHSSSRSWQRLLFEFGPLTRTDNSP